MTWTPTTFKQETWSPQSFVPEAENVSKPALNKDLITQLASGTLSFGQGGMPVFDELGAGAGALMEKAGIETLAGKVGENGDTLGQIYDKRLNNIRAVEKGFNEQHPYLDPALRFAGGVTAAAPFAGTMAARPVVSGAAYGAAQGFTGTNGGALNRTLGSGLGAGVGSLGGYAAGKLAPFIDKLGGAPASVIKSPEAKKITESLKLSGITPQQFAKRLAASSTDDFAGELGGESLRLLTQNKAKLPNPALSTARDAMRERLAQAPNRARGIIQNAFGSDEQGKALLSGIEEMKAVEPALYDKVSGTISTKELADILNRPAGQSAVKDASTNLANRTGEGFSKEFTSGTAWPLELPINQAHEIGKSLGGQIKRNPLTGSMDDPAQGQPIESLREQLISKLRGSSGAFDDAQTNAANIRQAEEAYSLGRKLARMSTGETADDALSAAMRKESVTPYSTEGFKQGLYDSIENVPLGTGNPVSRIAQQRTVDRARDFLGDAAADRFSKEIMAEKLRMELANRSLYGSNTPEALGEIADSIPAIGNPERWAFKKLVEKGSDVINAKSDERLAKALFSRTQEEKAALIDALRRGGLPAKSENNIIRGLSDMTPALPIQSYNALAYREN